MLNKIILGAAVCFVLAGCGGPGDTSSAPVAAAPAVAESPATAAATPAATATAAAHDELKAAVQAYSDAFLTGDGKTAYGLLSQRCRKRATLDEFTGVVEAAKQTYGSALPMKTFTASVSGDLARVTYTYAIKAIDQDSEPWVREGGRWHEDDC